MKRLPLNGVIALTGNMVHGIIRRDNDPEYRRTLCVIVVHNNPSYYETDAPLSCLECITEEARWG